MPRRSLFALALLAAVGGCDTGNPSSPLADVAGVYTFTELRFVPTATAIAQADVLSRLVASNTDVEVFGEGPALIRFQFQGGTTVRADANVTATRSTVQMAAATEADAARLMQILIPQAVTFSRGADEQRLTAQIVTTENLALYDPEAYGGVPPVTGTLYITLDRQSE